MKKFAYGTDTLTIDIAMSLAAGTTTGYLDSSAREKIEKSNQLSHELSEGEHAVYGVNTGFGPLCATRIPSDKTVELQYNLLRSHSVGVGDDIPETVSRLMLITKIHSLAQGFSGIQSALLERMIWHLEHDVIPAVPSKGSVGASGDLAPLAHLFLPLIGEGHVWYKGEKLATADVLKSFHLGPMTLGPKEGLALINGTQFILSFGIYFAYKFSKLLDSADIIGALSLEGLEGSSRPFHAALHEIRPYKGSKEVAYRLRQLLKDSEILMSHEYCDRVQDPYSLRCMPAVHGASRNACYHLVDILNVEMNSVTDNPIILNDGTSVSGGNFHGQPLAIPIDYAKIAAAEIGNISERRSYLLLEGKYGLPPMLIKDAGVNSGFMIPQYTAAALVTENRAMCFPTSSDSVPTGMGQEDHVSMGSISARKACEVAENVAHILSIELLYAAQALDFRRPKKSSPILEALHDWVRERVSFVEQDRIFQDDLSALYTSINNGELNDVMDQFSKELSTSLTTS